MIIMIGDEEMHAGQTQRSTKEWKIIYTQLLRCGCVSTRPGLPNRVLLHTLFVGHPYAIEDEGIAVIIIVGTSITVRRVHYWNFDF